jgi:hypothetical protein
MSSGSRRNEECFFYYFQEEETSLLKHLDRSRQEISGGSRRNEEKCVFYYFQEIKISQKCIFLLFPRNKSISFKAFGQVTSTHQVVQEEMKKNAFF